MYLLLLAIIYLAFISLGLPDSLLGSAWPVMQQVFDVPLSYAGIVTMIIAGGTIVSSLLSDRITSKIGAKYVTAISVLMTAAALFGFSTATHFYHLCLLAIPYGLGAGAIDAALNNFVALHYTTKHMSWLHCFWGVGTIISPYVMSYALTHSAWQNGYRSVSLIQFVIAVVMFCSVPLWKHGEKIGIEASGKSKPLGIKNALKIKGVPSLLVGFFGYCAGESTVMIWTSTYLVKGHNVPEHTAAALASLFYIGLTAGRFISGFFANRLGDKKLILYGGALAGVGIVLIILPITNIMFAFVGFVVVGLGCAPIYPAIIHATPDNFGTENSQGIIGIQMASAYTGSTFMPPLFGIIAEHISIHILPYFVGFFFILMVVMIEKTYKTVEKNK